MGRCRKMIRVVAPHQLNLFLHFLRSNLFSAEIQNVRRSSSMSTPKHQPSPLWPKMKKARRVAGRYCPRSLGFGPRLQVESESSSNISVRPGEVNFERGMESKPPSVSSGQVQTHASIQPRQSTSRVTHRDHPCRRPCHPRSALFFPHHQPP